MRVLFSIISKGFNLTNISDHTKKPHSLNTLSSQTAVLTKTQPHKKPLLRMLRGVLWINRRKKKENKENNKVLALFKVLIYEERVLNI